MGKYKHTELTVGGKFCMRVLKQLQNEIVVGSESGCCDCALLLFRAGPALPVLRSGFKHTWLNLLSSSGRNRSCSLTGAAGQGGK